MAFLYSANHVIYIARFCDDEAFVSIISTSNQDEHIILPLGVIGAKIPTDIKDMFDKDLNWKVIDKDHIELKVKARNSYFFECEMK